MIIRSYIEIITLNVNGLNEPTKRHRLAGCMEKCAYMHFHLPHHSVLPQKKLYVIILYYWVNHVVIMACNCKYIYIFWSGYWFWKLINIFYYYDYVTIN